MWSDNVRPHWKATYQKCRTWFSSILTENKTPQSAPSNIKTMTNKMSLYKILLFGEQKGSLISTWAWNISEVSLIGVYIAKQIRPSNLRGWLMICLLDNYYIGTDATLACGALQVHSWQFHHLFLSGLNCRLQSSSLFFNGFFFLRCLGEERPDHPLWIQSRNSSCDWLWSAEWRLFPWCSSTLLLAPKLHIISLKSGCGSGPAADWMLMSGYTHLHQRLYTHSNYYSSD